MVVQEMQINEQDLAAVLQKKINETVSLQLQVEALSRTLSEKVARIAELEGQTSSPNGKEMPDAQSRKEKVPLHSEG